MEDKLSNYSEKIKQFGGLGGIPKLKSQEDPRDIRYSSVFKLSRTLPSRFELDAREILDQGPRGTCAAFAMVTGQDSVNKRRNSQLFNYVKSKEICPFGLQEEGLMMETVAKATVQFGTVKEEDYPYAPYLSMPKMTFPSISNTLVNKALESENKFDAYLKLETAEEIKDHILHGSMVVGGFMVGLGTFFRPEKLPNGDAVIQLPAGHIAGHGMGICGWDDNMTYTFQNKPSYHNNEPWMLKTPATFTGFYKVVQSYGTGASRREFGTDDVIVWTESGYGWIPYEYVHGGTSPTGNPEHMQKFVNELYVVIKDMPVTIEKINAEPPFIRNGRTLLPIRFVSEVLGFKVKYDHEANRRIEISNSTHKTTMYIGNDTMYVNSAPNKMLAAPEEIDGRTYVPIRDVISALGCDIIWLPTQRKVEIDNGKKVVELWIGRSTARVIKRK